MIIGRLLAGGVKLWLRSQLTGIDRLKVKINGKNQQIMTGYIPEIVIAANAATYQGISLSQVEMTGVNIRFNLTEILKAQPFKLLEPISVTTKVLLKESDLQASLASPLLLNGLTDFWYNLLQQADPTIAEDYQKPSITWQEFCLDTETLKLIGNIEDNQSLVGVISGLNLSNPQTLLLSPITILGLPELPTDSICELAIDLGSDVTISELKLQAHQLLLTGTITIFPPYADESLRN